ncbi:hypothetical protein ACSQ67_024629 [Phaseolus vulgaris]
MFNKRRATLILPRLVPVVSSNVLHLHVVQSSIPNLIHFVPLPLFNAKAKSQNAQFSNSNRNNRQRHHGTAMPSRSAAKSSDRRPARLTG